jgi:7TM diverse intracellular signalling/7TMR-DISM extracellular 2
MRLQLVNPTTQEMPIKLEHTESRINKLTLYVLDPALNHSAKHYQFELFGPIAARPYPHHRPVFPFTVAAQSTAEVLLKFEYLPNVRGAIYTELRIWKSYAFEQNHLTEIALISLFFAIHILMGLITLSIYVVNRDRVFLFYSFYAFATVGTRAATNGMLGFWVYTDGMSLSELMLPIAVYQVTIFVFAREFLQVKLVAPKWDFALKFIMTCSVICIVLALSHLPQEKPVPTC